MDFSSTFQLAEDAARGATLHVRHPVTDEPLMDGETAVTITLMGADSQVFRATMAEMVDRSKGGMTTAKAEARACELLAKITTAWTGIDRDDEPLACNADNARRLYAENPWLRSQVDAFAADRGNFSRRGTAS